MMSSNLQILEDEGIDTDEINTQVIFVKDCLKCMEKARESEKAKAIKDFKAELREKIKELQTSAGYVELNEVLALLEESK